MTLSAFVDLSAEKKRATVLKQGAPVAKWADSHYTVFLFQLPHFYVETFCCKKTKAIHEFRIIHSTEHLAHYLERISIDGLFKE